MLIISSFCYWTRSCNISFSCFMMSRSTAIFFYTSFRSSIWRIALSAFSRRILSFYYCRSISFIFSFLAASSSLSLWPIFRISVSCFNYNSSILSWFCCFNSYIYCSCSDLNSFILRPCSIISDRSVSSTLSFWDSIVIFFFRSAISPLQRTRSSLNVFSAAELESPSPFNLLRSLVPLSNLYCRISILLLRDISI